MSDGTQRRLAAIVSTDVVGYSRLMGADEAGTLAAIPDDRWLSCLAKCVFQAGFNWKVVDSMWPGFETVFDGFDIGR